MRMCRQLISALVTYGAAVLLVSILPAFGQAGNAPDPDNPVPHTPVASSKVGDPLAVNPFTGLTSVSASDYVPLTGAQIWKLYFRQTYTTVGAYFGPAFSALVDQATTQPRQWGGGAGGFGKRLASRVASGDVIQNSFQYPLSVALKEDVRYISSDQSGTGHRFLHAMVYTVITYNYHGHPTPNVAGISCDYFAAALSSFWLPGNHRIVHYTFVNGSEGLAVGVPVNVVQEFWPQITEISRKLFRH